MYYVHKTSSDCLFTTVVQCFGLSCRTSYHYPNRLIIKNMIYCSDKIPIYSYLFDIVQLWKDTNINTHRFWSVKVREFVQTALLSWTPLCLHTHTCASDAHVDGSRHMLNEPKPTPNHPLPPTLPLPLAGAEVRAEGRRVLGSRGAYKSRWCLRCRLHSAFGWRRTRSPLLSLSLSPPRFSTCESVEARQKSARKNKKPTNGTKVARDS